MSRVAVAGAACTVGPSPTSRATRLEGLAATDRGALDLLLAALPDPPWDVSVREGEPLAGWLQGAGFEPYAETVTVARPASGLAAHHVPGVRMERYGNRMAEPFQEAEALALEGTAAFREIGQPSGYEGAEGYGAFAVALRGERVVGFCYAATPDGWITWMGVVPDERRRGLGRSLLWEVAHDVLAARGTHLYADVERHGPCHSLMRASGFADKGRATLLIRRG